MIPFSVLDLAPIIDGRGVGDALERSHNLALATDRLGYNRFWLAEHHNMPGIASAATAVMIAHVGQGTKNIRLGAGGIMLPNHSPMMVAEQFGTLAAMFPGRIDLGLGRAPGGDQLTAQALRRTMVGGEDRFPRDVMELQAFLAPAAEGQALRAVPGEGTEIPLWILGSSTFGAQLAAHLGLPYAFASHFAPAQMRQAVHIYRTTFQPSEQLDKPYVMLGFNMIAAPTDEDAQLISTSLKQAFVNIRRGTRTRMQPPNADFESTLRPGEREGFEQMLACSAVGSPETVERQTRAFIEETGADELILASHIYDEGHRIRSYEIAADIRARVGPRETVAG